MQRDERKVVLDTETTGLEPEQGHRVIEIGGVELLGRRLTGRRFHRYLQPDRAIDKGALEVHGITEEFLRGQPRFEDVADDFLRFIGGAELVIHNADFDVAFLDYELGLLGGAREERRIRDLAREVTDTLALARRLHPGQRNSLDALCKRYQVDNSQRDLHGALLDAEILAEVYLAMTGGQATLDLSSNASPVRERHGPDRLRHRAALRVVRATEAELRAHRQRLAAIDESSGGACLWKRMEPDALEAPGA